MIYKKKEQIEFIYIFNKKVLCVYFTNLQLKLTGYKKTVTIGAFL